MKLKTILVIFIAVSSMFAQAPPAPKPLTQKNILQLLHNDVTSERLADLVERYGIDFEPTDDFIKTLREAGAKDDSNQRAGQSQKSGFGFARKSRAGERTSRPRGAVGDQR